jgi:hypothetical protein
MSQAGTPGSVSECQPARSGGRLGQISNQAMGGYRSAPDLPMLFGEICPDAVPGGVVNAIGD